MIKLKKSVLELVNKAKKEINNLTVEECIRLHPYENNLFIDLRDIREIEKSEWVLRDRNVPRGILEFRVDLKSPYHKDFFNKNFHFTFYCTFVWRCMLATRATNEIGLLNTVQYLRRIYSMVIVK